MVFVLRHKRMRGCDNMRKTLVKREKIVEHKIELKKLYDQVKFNYQPPLFDPMNVIKLDEMLSDAYTITEELDERID